MTINTIVVGPLGTNCYIVSGDGKTCAVIDPGAESIKIKRYLEQNSLTCDGILITHGHEDHTSGLAKLEDYTKAPVYVGAEDLYRMPIDGCKAVGEGDVIKAGALEFKVIETPGHTEGGVCYICGDAMFAGDTIFYESVGRTDFPGGDFSVLRRTLQKIDSLPYDDLDIYPGHMQKTTLAHERQYNPFFER